MELYIMVKLYTNIILTKHYLCRVKHKTQKILQNQAVKKINLAHIINFIIGNPQLIMLQLLSAHHSWVKFTEKSS